VENGIWQHVIPAFAGMTGVVNNATAVEEGYDFSNFNEAELMQ
jgi:hypothetical protein